MRRLASERGEEKQIQVICAKCRIAITDIALFTPASKLFRRKHKRRHRSLSLPLSFHALSIAKKVKP